MMRRSVFIALAILLNISSVQAADNAKDCLPITAKDLIRDDAPKFQQYPAQVEKNKRAARLNLQSHPKAKKYRTVLKDGLANGPNFAGHYAVVVWGCGSGCATFAVVDLNTGDVFFPSDKFSEISIDPNRVWAEDFEAKAQAESLLLRYKINSRLLIVVGTVGNGDKMQDGAFYFLMEKNQLKPILSTMIKKKWCEDPE